MDGLAPDDPGWIGNYRLLGRLGEGGMGRVYLARSDRGRTVAVKVVKEELARKPDFRKRFAQEVKAAQRVGGEWTAPVLDADTEAATPWVATGYVAGPSLATVVDEQYGPLPTQSVRALAIGLVRALQAIHGAGIVHRDLKPSNVLVTIDGPRVIDFGIARALDPSMQSADGLTMTGVVVGSPGFMSPEQVRGVRVTYASDIFCLGAVLAYTVTGQLPFGAGEGGIHSLLFRIVAEEPDLSKVPEPWVRPIEWCLTKEPAQRPSLEQLLEHIEGMEDTGGAWLPGEVLAELGRHAVQLLNREDPQSRQAFAGQATGPDQGQGQGPGRDSWPGSGPGSPGSGSGSGSSSGAEWGSGSGSGPGVAQGLMSDPVPAPGPAVEAPVAAQAAPAAVPGPVAAPVPGFGPPVSYSHSSTPPPAPSPASWQSPPPGSLRPPSHVASFSPIPTVAPVRALGTGLAVLLGFYALSLVIRGAVVAASMVRFFEQDGEANIGSIENFAILEGATRAAESIELALLTALLILWVVWYQRVRSNAEAFTPGRIRHSTGMAVGSWFIPVVNLYMPKQISNDIWTATTGRPKGAKRSVVHLWWWSFLFYILLYVSDSFGSWYEDERVIVATETAVNSMGTCLGGIVASALAIRFVNRLTSLQQTRYQETRGAGR